VSGRVSEVKTDIWDRK